MNQVAQYFSASVFQSAKLHFINNINNLNILTTRILPQLSGLLKKLPYRHTDILKY